MSDKPGYECQYCRKRFMLERAFMNHKCREMERAQLIKTHIGQSAYALYSTWMTKNRRKVPSIDTFQTSAYFSPFIKFAEFIRNVNLPNPEKYVELMSERKISPTLWCRNECYCIYLEWNDRLSTPYEQADISVETILNIADAAGVSTGEAFDVLQPSEIIQLLIERKLSPWLLLCSGAFKRKLKAMDEGDHRALMRLIGIDYWATKIERNPSVIDDMKRVAKELGI